MQNGGIRFSNEATALSLFREQDGDIVVQEATMQIIMNRRIYEMP
jgi:RNA-binding protein YlmH